MLDLLIQAKWFILILAVVFLLAAVLVRFRKPRQRRGQSFWRRLWLSIKRFAGWLRTNVSKVWDAVWPLARKGPGGLAKVVVWVLSKTGVLIVLLFLLGIYGIAWEIARFGLQVGTQFPGEAFTTFFKWSALAFALMLAAGVTIPFFATLRKFVK